jgi:chromosome segregation ATPase
LRQEELAGIAKAIEILSSDDSKELFAAAIKPGAEPSFFQMDQSLRTVRVPALRAARVLDSLARRGRSIRLAAVAAQLQTMAHSDTGKLGHFDEVIGAIDKIIEQLLGEAKDDEAKQTECKEQYHEHSKTQADLEWKIKNNEAKIQKLEQVNEAKQAEKTETLSAIEDVTTQIKDMEEQRNTENAEFKQAKEDDEKAIKLLEEAKEALQKYHKSHASAALIQRDEPSDVAPDATFSSKNNREVESKGIISLLTMIAENLQNEISSGIKNEEAAQLDFENRLAAAKALKSDLNSKKANLDDVIAQNDEAIESTDSLKKDNGNLLTEDKDAESTIKPDCDSMIKNIGERREKRNTELAGLREAKSLLAGMDQASMVELSRGKFDDRVFPSIDFRTVA